jgi:hypothetical protein
MIQARAGDGHHLPFPSGIVLIAKDSSILFDAQIYNVEAVGWGELRDCVVSKREPRDVGTSWAQLLAMASISNA